jgi:hypothetical protein
MKINSLTHDAISQRAQEIWQNEGQPTGRDTEIWLTAEQQLSEPAPTSAARLTSETAAESVVEFHLPSSTSEEAAVRAALQTPESRGSPPPDKTAPQLAATAQVRGASTAQSTTTPDTNPPPTKPILTALATPAPQPSKITRAPQFPLKAVSPSGKPLFSKPRSS